MLATQPRGRAQWWPAFPYSVGVPGCGTGSSTYVGPGDIFAFDRWAGLRAYNTTDANNCVPLVDLVTTVGGTVHTVHSLTTGKIDTADALAFCGVGSCFVKKVYEYASGSALDYNASPATPGPFPTFRFNCIGTYPCMYWDGSPNSSLTTTTANPATGIVFFSAVADGSGSTSTTSRCASVAQTQARNELRFGTTSGLTPVIDMVGGGGLGLVTVSGGFHAANGFIAGAGTKLMIDGADNSLSQPAATDTNAGIGEILDVSPNTSDRCLQMEGGWKDNSQPSATIRGNLNTNQHTFYVF